MAEKKRERPKCWNTKGVIYKNEKELRAQARSEGKRIKTPGK